ncbi:hypothetical protein [Pseudomonas sp.]|uniref:hypothetical protein n=1 Tax=Pseudomonas sp. TaxID=306 RepID=UPI00262AF819|nr:hypothetical protein [Pseudomonas sp.]
MAFPVSFHHESNRALLRYYTLTGHNRPSDLAFIAYVLAIYSVLAVMVSMSLAATGNLVAEHANSPHEKMSLFRGGLSVAVIMASIALLVSLGLVMLMDCFPGAQMGVGKVKFLAVIYVGAIPLLVVNTFLHFFHEASGDARACSMIKAGATALSLFYLVVVFFVVDVEHFIFWAAGYFLFGETVLLVCLVRLSWARELEFSPMHCRRTVRNVVMLGFPIAFGLAGQKLYFYLLNEKLASTMAIWVAQLSVYMSVIGLFMIPVVAYCQAHSLYISRYAGRRWEFYVKGQLGLWMLVGVLLCALSLTGHSIFFGLGGEIVTFDRGAFISASCLLVSGSVLSLSTSHLRVMRDVLVPQFIMNSVMLSVLIPIIFFVSVGARDIHFYLRLQSAGLLAGFLFLQLRIRSMHARETELAAV